MEEKIFLEKDSSELANVIFRFIVNNEYDVFTSNYEMKRDILHKSFYINYIENKKEEFFIEFKKINFDEISMFVDTVDNKDFKNLQKILFNFKLALIESFKNDGVLPKLSLSTTSASPPLTRKVGNNKLDIKPTGRDYGLLFR